MDESIYLMLPFIGPSTVRDVPNLGVSTVTNILFYVSSPYVVPVALLGFIDLRRDWTRPSRFETKPRSSRISLRERPICNIGNS